MNYIEQLNWRYATKEFDKSKQISSELWSQIEQSLLLTPSSFGLQPWKFIVVTSDEIKQQLLPLSWGQAQVTDCSHFVVLCAKESVGLAEVERYVDDIVATRGGSNEDHTVLQQLMEGFLERMDDESKFAWAKNQVYIALGQLMASAAALEVDACPMEGITPVEFDKILQVEGYKTVVACAMGYRADSDKYATLSKVRYTADDLIERR